MSRLFPNADRMPAGTEDLEQLVLLLDRAGRQLGDRAALAVEVEERLLLNSLGLAVFMIQGQAVTLLPEDHVIPADVALASQIEGCSPVELLEAAEEITRSSSLPHDDLPGLTQLVARLCDAIREARDIDQ